jgi:hypothetical protein
LRWRRDSDCAGLRLSGRQLASFAGEPAPILNQQLGLILADYKARSSADDRPAIAGLSLGSVGACLAVSKTRRGSHPGASGGFRSAAKYFRGEATGGVPPPLWRPLNCSASETRRLVRRKRAMPADRCPVAKRRRQPELCHRRCPFPFASNETSKKKRHQPAR